MNPTPRLIIVAGANGSGKSSLSKRWQRRLGERLGLLLDPDAIAKEINPEFPKNAAIAAARRTLNELENALHSGQNVIIETTMSDKQRQTQLIQNAVSRGYRVLLWYVGVRTASINALRVAQRVSSGGHDVPLKDILRRRERSLHNLELVLPLVHKAWIFDNSGRSIRIVARVNNGVLQVERGLGWWSERLEGLKINAER
jgi:predicted ABC-type ATPase